jgi:hypothetical protein
MRAKRPVFAILLILGAGYIGYPYATLYRIDNAVRHSDAATLRSLVDWYSVREGLKEDICDMVMEGPVKSRADNELAPFGASFVRGMAGNALDHTVTPETLVSMGSGSAMPKQASGAHVTWAFFDSPTEFSVALSTPDAAQPIRLLMEFRDWRWQVRRVSLPNELLEHAGAGT